MSIQNGFQPTHPHGVRPIVQKMERYREASFNPRTRTGCDVCFHSLPDQLLGFNPRTRTGCDFMQLMCLT